MNARLTKELVERTGRPPKGTLTAAIAALVCAASLALPVSAGPPSPSVPGAAGSGSSPPAEPTQAASREADNPTQRVTVEARRELEQAVHTYVEKLTHSTRFHHDSIARFREPLCLAVAGMPSAETQYVLKRVPEIATAAGAQILPQGCSPHNFIVVFTPDADQLVKDWHGRDAVLFDANASPPQVDRFLTPSTPTTVRVWHNGVIYGRDGPVRSANAGAGVAPDPKVGFATQTFTDSRLTMESVVGLSLAIVVIDTTRTNGAKLGQLADYAAMVGLVDIQSATDLGDAPTILRLFTEPPEARPRHLTAWDQAFLKAIYQNTELDSRTQRSQIAGKIVQDVSP
jgi:hypothetical protein